MLDKKIKDEILHCLKKEKLHKIILFGSHAYGTSHTDSDIDLLIISDKKGMSKNYRAHLKNKNAISKHLLGIRKKGSIRVSQECNSMFSLENSSEELSIAAPAALI